MKNSAGELKRLAENVAPAGCAVRDDHELNELSENCRRQARLAAEEENSCRVVQKAGRFARFVAPFRVLIDRCGVVFKLLARWWHCASVSALRVAMISAAQKLYCADCPGVAASSQEEEEAACRTDISRSRCCL